MKTVLYLQSPWRLWRTRLAGVYRYAAKVGWHVQVAESGLTAPSVTETLAFHRPDGCIVDGVALRAAGARQEDFGDVPVVFCDPGDGDLTLPFLGVSHDSAETAGVAAGELIGLRLAHYAYVGFIRPHDWSERRREVFARAVADAGGDLRVFETGRPESIHAFFANIRPWLRDLPRPCGILGANDIMADLVLQACAQERLRVPEDIAVVGIDNDELLCEHCSPTLTSVSPDFEQSGWLAAQLLDEAMAGRVRPPRIVAFGSTHIVRRNSTRKFMRRDDAVRAALESIRARACDGLTPAEVVREIGGSRRQAETRFRALSGRSIGEEITAVRLDRAKSLLLHRDLAIETLHARCGYSDSSSLRRAFKKATGLSLRAWRVARGAL